MELDYNLYALFETVSFIQAVTLGSLLIVLNRNRYRSTLFLGIFLVSFGLGTLPIILKSLGTISQFPDLYLLPFNLFWIHFPVFYIYVHHICIFANDKVKYWVLYPGILFFLVQVAIFFQPYSTKLAITDSKGHTVYLYGMMVYGLSIGIYTLRLLYRHKVEVHNYFSMMKWKELKWARIFLIYNILGSIIYFVFSYTIAGSNFSKIFFASFDLILIYWVSYHGFQQRNIISLLGKKDDFEEVSNKLSSKEDLPALPNDGLEKLMQNINQLMEDAEPFMNSDLTIIDLAKELNTHPKRISTVINTICHQNFNTYVNQFRIKKAEKLLEDSENDHLSVEGIGHKVGFHSKSAFYSAFKKFTGTTPSKYKGDMIV